MAARQACASITYSFGYDCSFLILPKLEIIVSTAATAILLTDKNVNWLTTIAVAIWRSEEKRHHLVSRTFASAYDLFKLDTITKEASFFRASNSTSVKLMEIVFNTSFVDGKILKFYM